MEENWVSLRRAALDSGQSRKRLLQMVEAGELSAIPVEDGRKYLVRMGDVRPRPTDEPVFVKPAPPPRPGVWRILFGLLALAGTATFMFYHYSHYVDPHHQGLIRQTRQKVYQVKLQIRNFKLDHGRYPSELRELVRNRYLIEFHLRDAWHHPLVYEPEDGRIMSLGADGRWGGSRENSTIFGADIPTGVLLD